MKSIDIFGSQISLRFQGKPIHKTKLGACVTFSLFILVIGRLLLMILDRLEGKYPQIQFQEIIETNHKPFKINPNTFQMAVGIKNSKLKYIQDEKIFQIYGQIMKKNIQNGQNINDVEIEYTQFNLEICTQDHLNIQETNDPFIKQQVFSHYCLPKNIELEISGDSNSNQQTYISIILKKCVGVNCADSTQIDEVLKNNFVEILFTDILLTHENRNNPFKFYTRDISLSTSQGKQTMINLFLRNNVIESDFGWFQQNLQTKIYPSFSYQNDQILENTQTSFFQVNLQFEKFKENLYKRSYQSGLSIISDLGGFIQILIIICLILCTSYSQVHLNKAIIDETFNFQEQKNPSESSSSLSQKRISTQSQNQKNQNHSENQSKELIVDNQFTFKRDSQQQDQSHTQEIIRNMNIKQEYEDHRKQNSQGKSSQSVKIELEEDQSKNEDEKTSIFFKKIKKIIKSSKYFYDKQKESNGNQTIISEKIKEKIKEKESMFKKLIEKTTNTMNFNVIQYYLSYFCRIRKFRQKKEIIDYSIDRLYKQLDLQYILKKLIEVDKLKRLLLDENQIQLLEYLPKPTISYSFTKENKLVINHDQNDVFYHDTRSDLEKVNYARESFENIVQKQQLTDMDNKIISFMDERYFQLFQQINKKKQDLPKQQQEYSYFNIQYDEYHNNSQHNNLAEAKTIENNIQSYKTITPVKNPIF